MRWNGGRRFGLCAVVILAATGAVWPALASAFLQPPGKGAVILTFSLSRSSTAFDRSGRLNSAAFYKKSEFRAYVEYGVTEWLTLVFSPSLVHLNVQFAQPPTYSGMGDSELAARLRIIALGPVILSVQAGGLTRGDIVGLGHRGLTGAAQGLGDLRLMAGSGFGCGPLACFADVQLGYRTAFAKGLDEWRADLTFGMRLMQPLLLMVQSFSTFSAGAARPSAQMQSHKLQVSVVYDVSKRFSVQFGGFATLLGTNARSERGLITAVWYRF